MKIKKIISTLTGSLLLGSLLFILSGCCFFKSSCTTNETCQPTACDVCPADPIDTNAKPQALIENHHYCLHKQAENACAIGETYEYIYTITPKVDLVDVHLFDTIPDGAEYVSGSPEADVKGDDLAWYFGSLGVGDVQTIKVTMRAEDGGLLKNCARITAIPVACTAVYVGAPALDIKKTGPETACIGECVKFEICVTNTGNFPAECVSIKDFVPDGFTHPSGKRELLLECGDLGPGESTKAHINLIAEKGGELCNVAQVSAGNCKGKEARACVVIAEPAISVSKMGPSMQFMGKHAEYTIIVTNTGTIELNCISVVDRIPSHNCVISAPGASMRGSNAEWTIDSLAPAESRTLTITLCSDCACTCTNEVSVSTCCCSCNVEASDSVVTDWRGHAALLLEVVDVCDPLLVGETTDYIIKVCNQGTAADNNIEIRATLPGEIDPLRAEGPSANEISGKTVMFAPVPVLEPQHTLTYRISGRAVSKGDARIQVELTSDLIDEPLIEQESTQVY